MTNVADAMLAVLIWGVVATLAMNAVIFTSQNFGWSRLNMPLLLGTFFTGDRDSANTLGFLLYFGFGTLIAFVYYVLFTLIGGANWWRGASVGFVHGLLVLTSLLPLLPYMHPRVASQYDGPTRMKRLEPPGFLALHYGRGTPIVTLAAHVVYGIVLGAAFAA
jgi:hypothetical protein